MRPLERGGGALAAVGLLVALAAAPAAAQGTATVGDLVDEPPELGTVFYTPAGGPLPPTDAARAPAPSGAPVKAAVYVPECATLPAAADHVAYLQRLGLAVAVPALGGDRCVKPTEHLGTLHAEITEVAGEFAALAWVDGDDLFLIGHGVGADVVSTFTRAGVFEGMVGFAAACPFGVQNTTPMLTFRTLDDPVLRNRGTRCSQFRTENTMHLEFAGRDHVLRLGPDAKPSEARDVIRRALGAFLGVSGDGPAATIREGDELDLRQLGRGG